MNGKQLGMLLQKQLRPPARVEQIRLHFKISKEKIIEKLL